MTSDLRPLGPEEREMLLSALRSEGDKIMLRLLLETGRPLDDIRGARVSDLDLDRDVLRLRRGGEGRDVEKRDGEERETGEKGEQEVEPKLPMF